ncbi:MAG: DUF2922 domain-containing protein, partial [Eubacteriales bacterium]
SAEIGAAMELVIAKNVFTSAGGDLVSKQDIRLIGTTKNPRDVLKIHSCTPYFCGNERLSHREQVDLDAVSIDVDLPDHLP